MAYDNHTFTVLGHYRIITMILGREPTVSEFCRLSDYSRHGYHRLRRVNHDLNQRQSTVEDALMHDLYDVLKNKYE